MRIVAVLRRTAWRNADLSSWHVHINPHLTTVRPNVLGLCFSLNIEPLLLS